MVYMSVCTAHASVPLDSTEEDEVVMGEIPVSGRKRSPRGHLTAPF